MDTRDFTTRFESDRKEMEKVAHVFVNPLYVQSYGTAPPLPDVYVIIERRGIICATMGISWPDASGLLEVEKIYSLHNCIHLSGLNSANKVQFCRWASALPLAGTLVILESARYCIGHGKRYALLEQNEVTHRRAKFIGITFLNLPCRPADPSFVREEHRAFYAKSDLKPYLMDLEQVAIVLAQKVRPAFV